METISTTKLARKFSMSNRELESTLRHLGIEPMQSIEISGRRFTTWAKPTAEAKLRAQRTAPPHYAIVLQQELFQIKDQLNKVIGLLQATSPADDDDPEQ